MKANLPIDGTNSEGFAPEKQVVPRSPLYSGANDDVKTLNSPAISAPVQIIQKVSNSEVNQLRDMQESFPQDSILSYDKAVQAEGDALLSDELDPSEDASFLQLSVQLSKCKNLNLTVFLSADHQWLHVASE